MEKAGLVGTLVGNYEKMLSSSSAIVRATSGQQENEKCS